MIFPVAGDSSCGGPAVVFGLDKGSPYDRDERHSFIGNRHNSAFEPSVASKRNGIADLVRLFKGGPAKCFAMRGKFAVWIEALAD